MRACRRLIMDFTDRIGSRPEKPLIFFLLSFLNCDTHPDLAAVAWGLLQRYNVCVLWVQSPGLQHWKKSSLSLALLSLLPCHWKAPHWWTQRFLLGFFELFCCCCFELSIHLTQFTKSLITWKLTKPRMLVMNYKYMYFCFLVYIYIYIYICLQIYIMNC